MRTEMPELYHPRDLPESAFAHDDELVRDCIVVICEEASTDGSYLFYTDISRIDQKIAIFYIKSDEIERNISFVYPCTVILNRECGWFKQ